ncbi:hypothetical protein ACI7YT_12595 [Microbacterium sp. M]|uniref:hypothetical protein n=1 Tax=Microbacterium sp. M TaxID=3377125 RepID=UPI003869E862
MSNPTTPRTRRQLREALEQSQQSRDSWEKSFNELAEQYDALLDQAEADGWNPVHAVGGSFQGQVIGRTAPDRAAEKRAIEDATRRETLEKVIDALELRDYGYTADDYYPAIAILRDGKQIKHHERLWEDINTALEVREADKHAKTRRAIAGNIAKLAKRDSGFSLHFIPAANFDPENPKASDLLGGVTIPAEQVMINTADDPRIQASQDLADAASKLGIPKPAKKPAKKKGDKK